MTCLITSPQETDVNNTRRRLTEQKTMAIAFLIVKGQSVPVRHENELQAKRAQHTKSQQALNLAMRGNRTVLWTHINSTSNSFDDSCIICLAVHPIDVLSTSKIELGRTPCSNNQPCGLICQSLSRILVYTYS